VGQRAPSAFGDRLVGVRIPKFELDSAALETMSPGERLQAEELLRKFRERATWNPLQVYAPHPKQVAFHATIGTPTRMYAGGNRAGKTTCGICDDLIQATPRELLPAHLQDFKRFECPFYCRIVCPDFVSTMQPVIHQKLKEWTPKALLQNGSWDSSYDKLNRSLRMTCGCRFDFMTYEQALDKFGGAALHRCHFDEEPPEAIYKECLLRTLDFNGDIVITMTPLLGLSWTYDAIWERRDEDPTIAVVMADMEENPYLSREAMARILGSLTKDEIKARKSGQFVHFGGLVYDRETLDSRLVGEPSVEYVRSCENQVVIDPGVRVTAVTWQAFDRDNKMLVYDELYLEDVQDIGAVCELIKRKNLTWGLGAGDVAEPLYVIDPNARVRSPTESVTISELYGEHGIHAAHGQNAVEAGILAVRLRLERGSLHFVRGRCPKTLWELRRYRLDDGDLSGDRKSGRLEVVKRDDHAADTIRYGAMERPWMPPERRRDERFPPGYNPRDPDVAHPPPRKRQDPDD
jgi:phage terminase large subunit-like protein